MMPAPPDPAQWGRVLAHAADALAALGAEGWIVGGCLRDALLGRPVWDVDLAVTADPRAVAESIAEWPGWQAAVVPLPRGTHIRRVVLWKAASHELSVQLDIAAVGTPSIEGNLTRRDFTINALALPVLTWPSLVALLERTQPALDTRGPLGDALIDPLGGVADLSRRLLRAARYDAMMLDSMRILRGVRLAVTRNLTILPETQLLMRRAAPWLARAPAEAAGAELQGILAHPDAVRGLVLLQTWGALSYMLSERVDEPLDGTHGVATVAALDTVLDEIAGGAPDCAPALHQWLDEFLAADRTRVATLRWAALLYDLRADDPDPVRSSRLAGQVARLMGLGRRERAIITTCATHLADARALAQAEADDVLVRRYFAETCEAGAEALLVAVACERTRRPAEGVMASVARLVCRYLTDRDSVIPPQLLDGAELIRASGRAPGRWVGSVLARVRAAQIGGVVNDHDAALELALRLAADE